MPLSFTADQSSAIDYRKLDACVVAGPGSGKTTVLVERYRALIEDYRFQTREILAITFTEKAAANMKAKLAELFAHDPIRLRDLESAWVSTIHGFCARLLRENAIAAGIDPRFTVLDARESEELQYSCLSTALDELVDLRRNEALELIEALQTPYGLAGDLRNAHDAIRSAGKTIAEVRTMENPRANVTPAAMAQTLRRLLENWPANLTPARRTQRADLFDWSQRLRTAGDLVTGEFTSLADFVRLVKDCPLHLGKVPEPEKESLRTFKEALPYLTASAVDRHTAPFRSLVFDALSRFDELYTERKLALGVLDFNDLERRAVDLLRRNGDVRAGIKTQFRQVLLDEFQDINQQQSDLIDLVRGDDVFFAVGDINQSIYGFRHARPDIFQEYQAGIESSSKHSVQLLHNFRSRNAILRCVESILNEAEGIVPRELVAGASFAHKSTPSIEVLKIQGTDDRDETTSKEARWIAHRILSLRGALELSADGKTRRADFADFAVLCRGGDSMKPILEAFDQAGVPYVSGRRQSFLLSREGRDITALLHVIANPRDTIALATVLRSPLVGVEDEALLRIRLLASSLSGGLNLISHDSAKLADFAPEDAGRIERFAQNLKHWRAEQQAMPLDLLLVRALTDCGFEWTPGTVTADNVESFLYLARKKGEQRGLLDLLNEIESLQKAVNLESDLSDKDQGNAVQVMTAHSAKGLEFPVTIIAAMDKGTPRNSTPVTFTPTFGLGITWNDPAGKKEKKSDGLDDSWQVRNSEELKEREKQEENRLLYVAMTRAGERLILSYSRGKNKPQNWAKIVDALQPSADISILETEAEPPVLHASITDSQNGNHVLTVPRPAITGQYDSAVNVTSLAVFADCPRKYYLQRYIGWNGRNFSQFDPEDLPEEEGETDMSAADLGSAVHEILAGKSGSYPAEAQRLADVFLASELGIRAASAGRSAREWDFIIDVAGTLVRGTVDLWFEENNGEIVIVDYKTDTRVDRETYIPQLALYGLAIERALCNRPAHAWLHFLRPDTLVEVPLEAVQKVEDLLTQLRAAQDTLRFDLNEGEHCRLCQFYRGLCPAGL